jgi:thioredoxin reductase (NADPH)
MPQTEWAQEVGIVYDEGGNLVTGPDLQDYRANLNWPLERAPLHLESSMPGAFAAGRRASRVDQARGVGSRRGGNGGGAGASLSE